MEVSNLYDLYLSSTGISTDTRSLKEGQLFFALKGDNFDGNKYARQALSAGASAVIVDDPAQQLDGAVMVHDVLQSLQELATFHRRQLNIPVIGLTGSNGKTTSKELLVSALREKYRVAFTQGNLNNHIGVPLTLLAIPQDAEIAVVEMGANHQKEIAFLSNICLPDHGFITNYGKAHLEGFGGVQGIIKGKSELWENIQARQATAWVNVEDPLQEEKSRGIKTRYFYGNSEKADYPVYRSAANEQNYLQVKYRDTLINTQLTGSYNFSNVAIAIALAEFFEVEPQLIKAGIENYRPSNNRSQIDKTEHNTLVSDYYNANPSSMEAALENFKSMPGKGKWAVLGDMFELGADEEKEHQLITDKALACEFEQLILVGKAFSHCKGDFIRCQSTAMAVEKIKELAPHNKLILIKGSRGMQLEKVAAQL